MLELFAWAYSRSCKQYGVIRQSPGEIDAFRVQYRQQRKAIMGQIFRRDLHGSAIAAQASQERAIVQFEPRQETIELTTDIATTQSPRKQIRNRRESKPDLLRYS